MVMEGKRHRMYKVQKNAISKARMLLHEKKEGHPMPFFQVNPPEKRCRTHSVIEKKIKNTWTQIRMYDNKY